MVAGLHSRLFVGLLSLAWISPSVKGQLKVLSPPALVADLQRVSGTEFLTAATATFGTPSYGESFVGRLIPINSESLGCESDYKVTLHDIQDVRKIFVMPRGKCSFVRKVFTAEAAGADAVVLVDTADSSWHRKEMGRAIMADDGTGSKIRIPSIMICHEDAQPIMAALGRSETVIVQLIWAIPQQSIVDVDFWTESGSFEGQRFLKAYAYHAIALRGKLRFTPHYYVYSLSAGATSHENLCWKDDTTLCSNPPDIFGSVITGRDVLEEDVRQLCLFRHTVSAVDGIANSAFSEEWWEYVRRFPDECPMAAQGTPASFGANCSFHLMSSIPGVQVATIQKCVDTEAVQLLTKEKDDRAWSTLALRINGAKFSGSLDPVILSRAICSAFESPPDVCLKLTGLPAIDTGNNSAPHAGDTVAPGSIAATVLALIVLGAGGLYAYQLHIRKSMRTALRQEVMLEVRSQLQEYHQLDEEAQGGRDHRRPLILR